MDSQPNFLEDGSAFVAPAGGRRCEKDRFRSTKASSGREESPSKMSRDWKKVLSKRSLPIDKSYWDNVSDLSGGDWCDISVIAFFINWSLNGSRGYCRSPTCCSTSRQDRIMSRNLWTCDLLVAQDHPTEDFTLNCHRDIRLPTPITQSRPLC